MKDRTLSRNAIIVLLAFPLFCVVAAIWANQTMPRASAQQASQQDHPLFQAAEADWHNQQWEQAVAKYRQFVELFPSHPQAAEAHFQIGHYLSYVASPEEAIAEYEKTIAMAPGSHEAHESKIGIAALKFWLQDYEGTLDLFRQVLNETNDWSLIKECAFRVKELGRLIEFQKSPKRERRISMMDCGPKSLALIFKKQRINVSDQEMEKLITLERGGATLEQLRDASQAKGLKAWGIRLKANQFDSIPKPFIAFIRPNHYIVVTNATKERVEFTDPHRMDTYRTKDRFQRIWKGDALVFAKALPSKLRSQLLSKAEMEGIRGGHHLHGMNLGGPGGNTASKFEKDPTQCPLPGLPSWSVNLSNYNFLVQDTDFSYSGRGPGVSLTRTYNADDPRESAFGRSWTFNYDVFLVVNPNASVDVKREDGKVDNFVSRGDGTFDPPLWVHDQLFRNADGTYRLEIKRARLTEFFGVPVSGQSKLASITDRNGNSVTLQYNAGRLVSVTDAVGRMTRLNYNAAGKISEVVDPVGRRATFSYDGNNNLVSTIDMAGNFLSYIYNANSYMTSFTTPRGTTQIINGTTPYFLIFPFVVKDIIDPAGNTKHFDTGSEIAWVDDAKGIRTFYFNDFLGQTTEIEDPLGNKTKFIFSSGDLTDITDANSRNTHLTYDARGNVTRITDPLGNQINFQYDTRDNLTQLVDPLNHTYAYQYDATDNLTKVTDPKNGMTTFTHDGVGQLTALADARGSTTIFSYDGAGNLISVRNPIGGLTTYTYDGVGRLTSLTDPKGQTFGYNYDGIDRLTQIIYPGSGSTTSTYNCCDLTSVTDPSGTLSFQYDQANRLTRFTNTRNQVIQYGYDANRNLTTLTYPDGKVVRYEYDAANQLKRVIDWLNNTTTYNYDPAGNLISSINSNGTLTGYQYDNANRLASLINTRSNGLVISGYKYTLNGLGNRSSVAAVEPISPVLAPRNVSYTYDADNRIQAAIGTAYTHDANGNLTTISGANSTTYSYDVFDRLAQVAFSGYNAQYQYDGLGNRTSRTINGVATKYVVNLNMLLPQVIVETDNIGSITAYYVYAIGLISKILPTGQAYFYHYDGLGSTIAITDVSGSIVNRYAYDPFGNLSSNSVETISNAFRYVGHSGVMDEGNGLLYMSARYYDPRIGRFINKDPIGSISISNQYTYVNNDPANWVDPFGLFYFGKRPLNGRDGMVNNSVQDHLNIELSHEHGFFEDGQSPSNIGFGPGGRYSTEDPSAFQRTSGHYDDSLMRQALKNVTDGRYNGLTNNCQGWAERLKREYGRLERLRR